MLALTPSQTVGPFFAILVPVRGHETLVTDQTPGQRIVLEGSVRDGAGEPVPDALVEVWQANAVGHCNHPEDLRTQGRDTTFDGFGRVHAGVDGRFAIETIKPGIVPGPEGQPQAPHLVIGLFGRGCWRDSSPASTLGMNRRTHRTRSWPASSQSAGRLLSHRASRRDATGSRSCCKERGRRYSSMCDPS